MAIPIPNLTLSTGPQVADGRSGGTFAPNFGSGFFNRSSEVAGVPMNTLLLVAVAAGAIWLVARGKVKF